MKKTVILLALLLSLTLSAFCEAAEPVRIAIPGREGDVIDYMLALMQLDAVPVVIWDEYDPLDYDGLLLPGGPDIHPQRYGQEDVACGLIDEELDAIQFQAAAQFIEAGLPVFGVCRGHQLLNVYFGGTLIQHLDSAAAHQKNGDEDNLHPSFAGTDGFLYPLYGAEFTVNSAHHQAVDEIAPGLRAVQWSEDGVIEAMEHETLPILSVQWHPERMIPDEAQGTADGSLALRFFIGRCAALRA